MDSVDNKKLCLTENHESKEKKSDIYEKSANFNKLNVENPNQISHIRRDFNNQEPSIIQKNKNLIIVLSLIVAVIVTSCILGVVFHKTISSTKKDNRILQSFYNTNSIYNFKKESNICLKSTYNNDSKESCTSTNSDHSFIILEAADYPVLPKDIKYIKDKNKINNEANLKSYNHLKKKLNENNNVHYSEDTKKDNHMFYTYALVLNKLYSNENENNSNNMEYNIDNLASGSEESSSPDTAVVYFIVRDDGYLIKVFKPKYLADHIYNYMVYLIKEYNPNINSIYYNDQKDKGFANEIVGDFAPKVEYYLKLQDNEEKDYNDGNYKFLIKRIGNTSYNNNFITNDSEINNETKYIINKEDKIVRIKEKTKSYIIDNNNNKESYTVLNDLNLIKSNNLNNNDNSYNEDHYENFNIFKSKWLPKNSYLEISTNSNSDNILMSVEKNTHKYRLDLAKVVKNNLYEDDLDACKDVDEFESDKTYKKYTPEEFEENVNNNIKESNINKNELYKYNIQIEKYLKNHNPETDISLINDTNGDSLSKVINKHLKRVLNDASSEKDMDKKQIIYISFIKINKNGIEVELGVNVEIQPIRDYMIIEFIVTSPKGISKVSGQKIRINTSKAVIKLFSYIKKAGQIVLNLVKSIDILFNTKYIDIIKNNYESIVNATNNQKVLPSSENIQEYIDASYKSSMQELSKSIIDIKNKLKEYIINNVKGKINNPLNSFKEKYTILIKDTFNNYLAKLKNFYNGIINSITNKLKELLNLVNNEAQAIFLPDIIDALKDGQESVKTKIQKININEFLKFDFIEKAKANIANIILNVKKTVLDIKVKANELLDKLKVIELDEVCKDFSEEINNVIDGFTNKIDEFYNVLNNSIDLSQFLGLDDLLNKGSETISEEINKIISVLETKKQELKDFEIYREMYVISKNILKLFKKTSIDNIDEMLQVPLLDNVIDTSNSRLLLSTSPNDKRFLPMINFSFTESDLVLIKSINEIISTLQNKELSLQQMIVEIIPNIFDIFSTDYAKAYINNNDIAKRIIEKVNNVELFNIIEQIVSTNANDRKLIICNELYNNINTTIDNINNNINPWLDAAKNSDLESILNLKELPNTFDNHLNQLSFIFDIINNYKALFNLNLPDINKEYIKETISNYYNNYKDIVDNVYSNYKNKLLDFVNELKKYQKLFVETSNSYFKVECGLESNTSQTTVISSNLDKRPCLVYDLTQEEYALYYNKKDNPVAECLIYADNLPSLIFDKLNIKELVADKGHDLANYIKQKYSYANNYINNIIDNYKSKIDIINNFDIDNLLIKIQDYCNTSLNISKKLENASNNISNKLNSHVDNIYNKLKSTIESIVNTGIDSLVNKFDNIPVFIIKQIDSIKNYLSKKEFIDIFSIDMINDIVTKVEISLMKYVSEITINIETKYTLYLENIKTKIPLIGKPITDRIFNNIDKKIKKRIDLGEEKVISIIKEVKENITNKVNIFINNIKMNLVSKLDILIEKLLSKKKVDNPNEIDLTTYFDVIGLVDIAKFSSEFVKNGIEESKSIDTIKDYITFSVHKGFELIEHILEKNNVDYEESLRSFIDNLSVLIKEKIYVYYEDVKDYFQNELFTEKSDIYVKIRQNIDLYKAIVKDYNLRVKNKLNNQVNVSISKLYKEIEAFANKRGIYITEKTVEQFNNYKIKLLDSSRAILNSYKEIQQNKINKNFDIFVIKIKEKYIDAMNVKNLVTSTIKNKLSKLEFKEIDIIFDQIDKNTNELINKKFNEEIIIAMITQQKNNVCDELLQFYDLIYNQLDKTLNLAQTELSSKIGQNLLLYDKMNESDKKAQEMKIINGLDYILQNINFGEILKQDLSVNVNDAEIINNQLLELDTDKIFKEVKLDTSHKLIKKIESFVETIDTKIIKDKVSQLLNEGKLIIKDKIKSLMELVANKSTRVYNSIMKLEGNKILDSKIQKTFKAAMIFFKNQINKLTKIILDIAKKNGRTSKYVLSLISKVAKKTIVTMSNTLVNMFDKKAEKYIEYIENKNPGDIIMEKLLELSNNIKNDLIKQKVIEVLQEKGVRNIFENSYVEAIEEFRNKKNKIVISLNEKSELFANEMNSSIDNLIKDLKQLGFEQSGYLDKVYIIIENVIHYVEEIKNLEIDNVSFSDILKKSDEHQKEFIKITFESHIDNIVKMSLVPVDNFVKDHIKKGIELTESKLHPYLVKHISTPIKECKDMIISKGEKLIKLISNNLKKASEALLEISRISNNKRLLNEEFLYNFINEYEDLYEENSLILRNLEESTGDLNDLVPDDQSLNLNDLFKMASKVKYIVVDFKAYLHSNPKYKETIDGIKSITNFFSNSLTSLIDLDKEKLIPFFKELSVAKFNEYVHFAKEYALREESLIKKEYEIIKDIIISIPKEIKELSLNEGEKLLNQIIKDSADHWAVEIFNALIKNKVYKKEYPIKKTFGYDYKYLAGPAQFTMSFSLNFDANITIELKPNGLGLSTEISSDASVFAEGKGSVSDTVGLIKVEGGIRGDGVKFKGNTGASLNLTAVKFNTFFCADASIGKIYTFLEIQVGKEFERIVTEIIMVAEEACDDLGIGEICKTFTYIPKKIIKKVTEVVWKPSVANNVLVKGYNYSKCFNYGKEFNGFRR